MDLELNRVHIQKDDANIEYSDEYLDATSHLVDTSLTKRCYIILTTSALSSPAQLLLLLFK